MRSARAFAVMLLFLSAAATCTVAQPGNQGRVASDFMREQRDLEACKDIKTFFNCAQALFTDQPLHIAVGSLAPQNGFAFGLAFVEHKNCPTNPPAGSSGCPREWRFNWDVDAGASDNGSWRAGAYMKAFRLSTPRFGVTYGTPKKQTRPLFHVAPLFNLYAETTSLNLLYYYGLGPNTLPANQTAFGLTETIVGASADIPTGIPGVSLYAELNGRIPELRGNHSQSVPSIEQVYTDATAPGLSSQPAFFEPGEALRLQPPLPGGYLRLNYLLEFQNFIGVSGSNSNFRRWTADLGHEIPFDRKVHLTAVNEQNGPDSCTPDPEVKCPSPTHVSTAINHEGSINFHLLMTGSAADANNTVPFYYDPTIGGSDINGQSILPSYPDYRFRAPNLVLLRETVEHAIPKVPLGAYFSVDEGKVGLNRNDINFSNLRTSYTVGLTVHAGGLPVVYLLFAWGGSEGNHTTFNVSNVLLGASARPSLF
jgi:hypothetical protein